jgi:transposase InsO family protein
MRKESAKTLERNLPVVALIRQIKGEHPFWGYRRLWAYLHFAKGLEINKKRVLRLMRRYDLLVKPNQRIKAVRTPQRSKPRPDRPNQWWGIDMTKVKVGSFGWMYIVLVLDWYTKKIVGYYAGVQCTTRHWLEALDMAVNQQFPEGVRGHELSLMSDNGCQPTAVSFMTSCRALGINQAFTSYNNPKGNADTERVIRTLKEECLWLREWENPFELVDELKKWADSYNQSYLHSALGYKPPVQAEVDYYKEKTLVKTT